MKIKPVIMAGGAGTRLWPLSRENYPKQFIKILDGKSLLQHCLIRNRSFLKPMLIVGNEHRFIALEQAKEVGVDVDIILEPQGKNTAPCAIISALIAEDDEIVALLPADHFINDVDKYVATIEKACDAAKTSTITTIGIKPQYPHTGYGYIEVGEKIAEDNFHVNRFVEKPSYKTAEEYCTSGKFLWNSGMFMFRPDQMYNLAEKYIPEMLKLVRNSYEDSDKDLEFTRLKPDTYSSIKADSIDYAIIEKATGISSVRADFAWNDLGSFSSIWDISDKGENNNVFTGDVVAIDGGYNYVYSPTRLTTIVGLSNLVVISTEDATLVTTKDKSEEVKSLVKKLSTESRKEVTDSVICYRPWGSYQTIDESKFHKVKKIIVKPSHKLSLQYHYKRAEHWVVVQGVADVQVGEETHILKENDSIYIPKLIKHRLSNIGEVDLHLIEVQTGSDLSEADIVRLSDDYGRK